MLILEYIWIDANNSLQSKTKIIKESSLEEGYSPRCTSLVNEQLSSIIYQRRISTMTVTEWDNRINECNMQNKLWSLPNWRYTESPNESTEHEIILKPRFVCRDPFRKPDYQSDHISLLVLCDTYDSYNNCLSSNNRVFANNMFNKKLDEEPWFGFIQSYFTEGVIDKGTERYIADEHLQACLYAELSISSIQLRYQSNPCAYQIGPCLGIDAGDELWMTRYILDRIFEKNKVKYELNPSSNYNMNLNYSTKNMREGTVNEHLIEGLYYINSAIKLLSNKHTDLSTIYSDTIMPSYTAVTTNYGYLIDKRPDSNCDPYLVTAKIFETTVLYNYNETSKL